MPPPPHILCSQVLKTLHLILITFKLLLTCNKLIPKLLVGIFSEVHHDN